MMRQLFQLLLGWLLISAYVYANPMTTEQVPEPLKPWVGWVLDGKQDHTCPYFFNESKRQCAWPGILNLSLNDKGGSFTQTWEVYGKTTIRLPGDTQHWPQGVVAGTDNKTLAVLETEGHPVITLDKGSYSLSGQFVWDSLPETLLVSPETGLVALSINEKPVANPEFNEAGSVWLSRTNEATSEDNLDIQVYRQVHDGHPLEVTTQLQLQVSGKQRNIELPAVLLDKFIPLKLESPLSTRMDQNGKLQVQLRPGEWTLSITGRAPANVSELTLPKTTAPWPSEEVWVFNADNNMRQVQIEGVNSIDPSQTRLPEPWKTYPAYLVTADSSFKLAEQHRGLTTTPAQLNLERQMWLDFAGTGYTVRDHLTGMLSQQTRLEVLPDIQLGRIMLNDKPQLITRQANSQASGVEVRQQALSLEADSRYEAARSNPPVSGWQQELQQVNTTLHLPPGWLLFAATGTDNLPDTWLQHWSLLDLFLVLLITVATGYLYGWQWGVLAALALVLTWHQSEAPRYIWLNLLAATALLQALSKHSIARLLRYYRWLSLLLLVVIILPYTIDRVRIALYPQLEYAGTGASYNSATEASSTLATAEPIPAPSPAALVMQDNRAVDAAVAEQANSIDKKAEAPAAPREMAKTVVMPAVKAFGNYKGASKDEYSGSFGLSGMNAKQMANLQDVDPNSMIQTGPGLPNWQWRQVQLNWSGVIKPDERMGLWLIPPFMHSILIVLGVVVLWLLAARVALDNPKLKHIFSQLKPNKVAAQASVWLLCTLPILLLLSTSSFAASPEVPDQATLQSLEERLTRDPDCLPDCAQIENLHMVLQDGGLSMRLRAHAATSVAIPIPGNQSTWLPKTVNVDDQLSVPVWRDDEQSLWVTVPAGQHDILLQGSLPNRSNIALALPLKPHRVTWQGTGWQVDGIRDNGVPEDQLQLNRTETTQASNNQDMPTLPAFVKIQRRLELGLDWYITTTISRISDAATPITLNIPLLAGEQPLSEQFTIKDKSLQINLKPQQDSLQWTSRLAPSEQLQLTASENNAWLEEWQIAASPIWHVESKGIPASDYTETNNQGVYTWKPWPKESLELSITRPQGVQGQTVTILGSQTQIDVGKRARDVTLKLNLDSSRGTQHSITIPENATLKSLTIDGTKQAIQQQQGKVILPLMPKKQEAELKWQEEGSLPFAYRFPAINTQLPSVNHEDNMQLPQDRWVLWVKGSLLGPAVLFWGQLIVILGFSILLGRSHLTPLKTWQWFLLGVGLSQSSAYLMIVIAAWLIALAWRSKHDLNNRAEWQFDLVQVGLVLLTIVALINLVGAVANGLLGLPDMQIAGNNSSASNLNWYQDRMTNDLPQPLVISVPMLFYRLLMLAWALWLALALLGWLRWGWQAFSNGGLWRKPPPRTRREPHPIAVPTTGMNTSQVPPQT
jgi:hypothetical protein